MVEFEAAVISIKLEKGVNGPSNIPNQIKESGLGDVEGQLRWQLNRESESRPEYFSFFETVFLLQKDKKIIGTQVWELKFGIEAVKGFRFGTVTFRTYAEYDESEKKIELGEYAIEYLKKLSNHYRLFSAIEGSQDEV